MPTSLSQHRKREFERKLSHDFGSFTSKALDRYLEANFALYKYKPNISSVVKMISASAKGYGNCLGEGGYGILLAETIRNFNHQRSLKHAVSQQVNTCSKTILSYLIGSATLLSLGCLTMRSLEL